MRLSRHQCFLFALVNILVYANGAANLCKKVNSCVCMFDNGTGISLQTLDSTTYFDAYKPNTTYFFHPCNDTRVLPVSPDPPVTPDKEADCHNGYSVCMYDQRTKIFKVIGRSSNVNFNVARQSEAYLEYQYKNITTSIQLVCVDIATPAFVAPVTSDDLYQHNLVFYSDAACFRQLEDRDGLSLGTIFCLLLFTGLLCYFVVGSLVRFFFLGAVGIEICPHVDFWRSLPSLFLAGVAFVRNGCKVAPDDIISNFDDARSSTDKRSGYDQI